MIICEKTVLDQWIKRITDVAGDRLNVYKFYDRDRDINSIYGKDIVITTYKTVTYDRKANNRLFAINWRRLVLDDAKAIKNTRSQLSIAISALRSRSRWAVTGAPIQNSENDFKALLSFVCRDPIVTDRRLCLRRTISDLQRNGQLQQFPQIKREEIRIKLNVNERILYDKVRDKLNQEGEGSSIIDVVQVKELQLLCSHPYLIRSVSFRI